MIEAGPVRIGDVVEGDVGAESGGPARRRRAQQPAPSAGTRVDPAVARLSGADLFQQRAGARLLDAAAKSAPRSAGDASVDSRACSCGGSRGA
jgi:hypothetical protein